MRRNRMASSHQADDDGRERVHNRGEYEYRLAADGIGQRGDDWGGEKGRHRVHRHGHRAVKGCL